jgi:hypothetical protein
MCDLFGGPSEGETTSYDNQVGITNSMRSAFNQQYGQQQGVLGQLNAQIMRIQSGQTGPGYGGAENASNIALIQNQGAAQARNAIQAERTQSAGVGGGGTSGLARSAAINRQISGGIEALAGANTSNQLIGEQAANYAQGRASAQSAVQGFQALAGDYNPLGYANASSSSNQAQFGQADKINQQKIAASQAELGMIEKGAATVATAGAGGFAALGGGESFGEGLSDFASGASNATFGTNFGING